MQETNQWATDGSLPLPDGPWQKKKKKKPVGPPGKCPVCPFTSPALDCTHIYKSLVFGDESALSNNNILVKPLHISNHFFITFNLHLHLATCVPPTPLPVTFRRNLHSLSPSHLSSVVSSSLPSPIHFSSLEVNAATDTLCFTLTSCLDVLSPPGQHVLPGYLMFFMRIGPNSGQWRENGTNQKIHQT